MSVRVVFQSFYKPLWLSAWKKERTVWPKKDNDKMFRLKSQKTVSENEQRVSEVQAYTFHLCLCYANEM